MCRVGNMALDLAAEGDVACVKSLQGPHPSTHHQHERSTIAFVLGFPLGNNENGIRTMVQKKFNLHIQCPRMDVVPVDKSSAFVGFRNPHLCAPIFEVDVYSL